jgi:alkylhydroperoxidase/carboxymuconolactone decarboxylase family protein YurZ
MFLRFQQEYPAFFAAWDALGTAVRAAGPIDLRAAHLIQLAAAAAIRSEGAVHSHVRRAIDAGASPEEVRQALLLTAPTIGFPNVIAALSWAEDILRGSGAGDRASTR